MILSLRDKIVKLHRIPCGPAMVTANKVCRRQVTDQGNELLNKLQKHVNPSYEENLQGNSKMLQDVSGKLSGWRDKGVSSSVSN